MNVINGIIKVLITLIGLGSTLRIIICAMMLMGGEEENASMVKKRIRNALIFLILALTAGALRTVIVNYYA